MAQDFAKTLGLTDYEIKVYLALVKYGQLSGSEAAKKAGIPNAKVYNTLKSLAEKNLAIKVKEKPIVFKCIEPKSAIEARLDEKKAELETAARNAINFFKQHPIQKQGEEVFGNIELNVGTEQRLRNSYQLHKSATKYYYMVSPVNYTLPMYLLKARAEAVKRGVDERFIVSRLDEENKSEVKKYCQIMEIRLLEDSDYRNISLYVWDDKKFIIVVSDPVDRTKSITVTIDSSDLARAMKKYFLELYKKAKPTRL